MNRRKEILDELNETAPNLAGFDAQLPFRVPTGYFDTLPSLILSRIKAESAGSAREELEIISPLLDGISKKMPFATPEGYFENLTPTIRVADNETHKPARVVKMFQPQRTFRYAAAAVTVGVIGIAAWLFFMNDLSTSRYAMKPDVEVQKELKNDVGQLSEKELAAFLEGNVNTSITTYDGNISNDINEADLKLMLADIPDQELEKYVDQNTVKEEFN
jgi:hypothetical protein